MIVIASDHGGFALKQEVMAHLEKNGVAFKDVGCFDSERCDYPVFAKQAAEAVASGEYEKGILICGTGIGMSIAANKVHGIRCAVCSDCYSAEMTRQHNNANMLALGGRVIGPELALRIVDIFLNTEFIGGRHTERLKMVAEMEEKQ